MEIDKYISLKEKLRQGKASKDEQQAMQQWMQSAEGKSLQKVEELADLYVKSYEPEVEAGWSVLKARMQAAKAAEVSTQRLTVRRMWIRVAAAALIVVVAMVAMRSLLQSEPEMVVVATTEESRNLTLTDGTKVQLNSNSKLTLPASFEAAKERVIQLSGEAYFSVSSNPAKPFKVQAEAVTITVVGTMFNVRAYPGEETTEVEVEEGTVVMNVGSQSITLTANEKGVYNSREDKLYKRKARQLNAQAWRTHSLVFQKEPLSEIIQQLERYHHVKIDIANESLKRCAFTCNFRKTKLDDALKVLQIGMKLQWEKAANNHYIIRDGICQ